MKPPFHRSKVYLFYAILLLSAVAIKLSVASVISPGPLTKVHSSLEGSNNCVACHEGSGKQGISTNLCLACHDGIRTSIDKNRGYHAKQSRNCATCHKEHIGVSGRLIRWDPKAFKHEETGWKLDGKHQTLNCTECHKKKDSYSGLKSECLSCHKDQHGSDLKRGCLDCHSNLGWKTPAPQFDHSKTSWKLTGKHVEVACAQCHKENKWNSLSKDCRSCHNDPHKGKFNQNCTECHSPGGWNKLAGFDHTKTGFTLNEAHALLRCDACHNPKLKPVLNQRSCVACHTDRHQGQLGNDCKTCHNETKFIPSLYTTVKHNQTGFQLAGKHLDQACNKCHKENRFKFTSDQKKCNSCHQDQHKGQLSTNCQICHTVDHFKPSTFTQTQHDTSHFRLAGKHATLACNDCHKDNRFAFTAQQRECLGCHKDQHKGQLSSQCTQCHSNQSWKPSNFGVTQHATTQFALIGKHATTNCTECHKDGKFKFAASELSCNNCHAKNDHHNGTFGKNCEQCHSPMGWKSGIVFNHRLTRFPLEGTHQSVDCKQCHSSGKYAGIPMECNRCHTDVHQGYLSQTCTDCHRPSRWNDLQFSHTRTNFPLQNKHQTTNCTECHKTQRFADASTECYSCHQKEYDRMTDPNHAAAGFAKTECVQCHRNGGPDWRAQNFSHTSYALVGKHSLAYTSCTQCHVNGHYSGTTRECNGCHSSDFTRAGAEHPAHLTYPRDCTTCHQQSASSWEQTTFTHTNFPLTGRHATQVTCTQCHLNNQYAGTPTDCYTCHWTRTQSDLWRLANGTNCGTCHNTGGWTQNVQFDHNTVAHYQLQGKHAQKLCIDCHTTRTPASDSRKTNCVGCHQTVYNSSANPNHQLAGFNTQCATCHSDADQTWFAANYAHTLFPLSGRHASPQPTACNSCHTTRYSGTSSDCYTCHTTEYDTTSNPTHRTNQTVYPTSQCGTCHTSGGQWSQANFNHTAVYPLTGRHATASCNDCHHGNYNTTSQVCYSCHRTEYDTTSNPSHSANPTIFPTAQCGTCHTSGGQWTQANFNHTTVYPLSGRHATATCNECHHGTYMNTPTNCYHCHTTEYDTTSNPSHSANPTIFPTAQCGTCHTSGGQWTQANFNHTTVYPLSGRHATAACNDCHHGTYSNTPTDCYRCHTTAYDTTSNPSHHANPTIFPTSQCGTCHPGRDAWRPATFNHSTVFALNGRHSTTTCVQCHVNNQYSNTPTDCFTCHWTRSQDDLWRRQIGDNCGNCHDPAATNGWTPTHGWTHTNDGVFGQGIHAQQTCVNCHQNRTITGATTDCRYCHSSSSSNYCQQPVYPANHTASPTVFGINCSPCHGVSNTTWQQGRLSSHSWFILTGDHNVSCDRCHPNTATYIQLDCITCHNGCTRLQNQHNGVSGFICNSNSCITTACHGRGGGGGRLLPQRGISPTAPKLPTGGTNK